MLSIQDVKRLMNDDSISDEEAVAIRDACYELGAIIVEHWKTRRIGDLPRHSSDHPLTP